MTLTHAGRHFARYVLLAGLAACTGPIERADQHIAQEEWMKAVLEYREALAQHPGDVEFRSRLRQTELKAADFYYQRGLKSLDRGELDGAIVQFQQGLAAMPDHDKLQQVMNVALARKEGNTLYQEALRLRSAGKSSDAVAHLERALRAYPGHPEAEAVLKELQAKDAARAEEGLALASRAPITLNFRQTDLRTAFDFLARSFGVNIIFDDAVKNVPVGLYAKDVTFYQGLNLLLATTRTFSKRIGPNTLLVAPDTKEKRGQYEEHIVRMFSLNVVRAKDMAEILKSLLKIDSLIVNEDLNSLIIRDTEDVLELAQRLIRINDRKQAEMILEVEILEVNRSKAERLGLDLGSQVSVSFPTFPVSSSFQDAVEQGVVTLPTATFRYFKQDVDAKTLANPKVRVLNGKEAKIHIGDRVPLRSATIVDATGQTRTTFEYRDIGIRLTAQPTVHLDNSSTVKIGLEVSTLGENLGTANEPAFRIGTRNADTFMLLRDGETAILGGLIRDDERTSRVRVPGLGDIPVAGLLFTSADDSSGRSDVLLTITPRIVRGWDIPDAEARQFYSGTESTFSTRPLFAYLNEAALQASAPARPQIASESPPTALDVAAAVQQVAQPPPPPAPAAPVSEVALAAPPVLAFSEALYEVAAGSELEIRLTGRNLQGVAHLPIQVLYNPQFLRFERGERGSAASGRFDVEAAAGEGVLRVTLELGRDVGGDEQVLAHLRLQAEKPGISYLVYRTPALRTAAGVTISPQLRASRVVIK